MEHAYQNIPGKEASWDAIKAFIESDVQYNNSNNFNGLDEATLRSWYYRNKGYYSSEAAFKKIEERLSYLEGKVGEDTSGSHDAEIQQETESELRKLADIVNGIPRTGGAFTDVLDNLDYYTPTDEDVPDDITNKVSTVLSVLTSIGIIVAILMSAIMGIKYMLGSVEEKADYKKDMIPYLIGAVLLFAITVIVKVLQQIGQSINEA